MKKFFKENLRLFLGIVIGTLASSITVFAVNNYSSNQIRYQNDTFAINNVSEALDDLYSYSKEKIDNYAANNYSTEEQVIGTWIDGKPLYQRVLGPYTMSISDSVTTAPFSSDLLTLIRIIDGHIVRYSNTGFLVVPCELWEDNGLNYKAMESWGYAANNYFVIQYTKTTDTATN